MQAQVNLLLTKITSPDKFNIQEVDLMDRFASLLQVSLRKGCNFTTSYREGDEN